MAKPTLYLLLGLPGAGKTTTAKEISRLTGAVHLSSDKFRLGMFEEPQFTQDEHDALYKTLDHMCELLLKNGTSVVYDANLNRHQHREEKYKLAKRLKVEVRLLWIEAPRALAKKRRVATQHHDLVPTNETPASMFERIADIFEPPQKDEKPIKLDGTKITADYVADKLSLEKE
jgi:predicted kinase